MERLTRDLKLHRITPNELIKIVLPTKAIKNERILETLMYQANSGIYRINGKSNVILNFRGFGLVLRELKGI